MPLTIKIVSEHRDLVGEDHVREFHEEGGTIGRSLQNDWILPDPDLYISGRHATIDHKGGVYYLADTSSNGVYMNGENEPVGKGNPRRLFDGDQIRMGDFEFEVRIDKGESLIMPLDEISSSISTDHFEMFVDEELIETGMQLLDEEEITGDEEFRSVLFGKEPENAEPEPEPEPEPESVDAPQVFETSANDASAGDESTDAVAADLFDSFLDGLGISQADLHPSVKRPELMMTAGLVLREFVEGSIKLLGSRSSLKNAFRLDQTTALPRHNNPLKFSENAGDLIKQLLVGDEGDYLGPRNAVREVCQDLLNHQNAILDAMSSAVDEFVGRFDPNDLQEDFDQTLGEGKLFKSRNKSQYWDLYCDLYVFVTEKDGDRFPQAFGEEFVRAYERQVAEYRRCDREGTSGSKRPDKSGGIASPDKAADPGLVTTQKLESPGVEEADGADQSLKENLLKRDALELDKRLIDEFEDSLVEEADRDQLSR
jgi:predicted component of type VI protein secretion system